MTEMKKRLNRNVILCSILLILFGGFSFFKGAELLESTEIYGNTIETLDEKRGNVMGMTAALVGTSTLITGLPDDMGTPVAEQLMDMTDWLLVVLCVVFLEKYGMAMLWAGVCKVMIPPCLCIGYCRPGGSEVECKACMEKTGPSLLRVCGDHSPWGICFRCDRKNLRNFYHSHGGRWR